MLTCVYLYQDGSITCHARLLEIRCPVVNCVDAVQDPNTCCPVCEGSQYETCTYAGRQYQPGEEVLSTRDRCEVCRCVGGFIECTRRGVCPVVTCRNPGNDGCCDTCEGQWCLGLISRKAAPLLLLYVKFQYSSNGKCFKRTSDSFLFNLLKFWEPVNRIMYNWQLYFCAFIKAWHLVHPAK